MQIFLNGLEVLVMRKLKTPTLSLIKKYLHGPITLKNKNLKRTRSRRGDDELLEIARRESVESIESPDISKEEFFKELSVVDFPKENKERLERQESLLESASESFRAGNLGDASLKTQSIRDGLTEDDPFHEKVNQFEAKSNLNVLLDNEFKRLVELGELESKKGILGDIAGDRFVFHNHMVDLFSKPLKALAALTTPFNKAPSQAVRTIQNREAKEAQLKEFKRGIAKEREKIGGAKLTLDQVNDLLVRVTKDNPIREDIKGNLESAAGNAIQSLEIVRGPIQLIKLLYAGGG